MQQKNILPNIPNYLDLQANIFSNTVKWWWLNVDLPKTEQQKEWLDKYKIQSKEIRQITPNQQLIHLPINYDWSWYETLEIEGSIN